MIKKLIKLIFPDNYACFICGEDVFNNKHIVCDHCIKTLPYLTGKLCLHCGEPLIADGNYCKRCKGKKFLYDRAISPFKYTDEIKNLIIGLKYNNKKYNAKCLASFMADCFNATSLYADVIIPVPLCESRLKQRKYNQAEVLANEVSKHLNKKLLTNILFRVKETPSQTNLDFMERKKNLKDAFKVKGSKKPIKDKFVLLIDDVFTTGATTTECAKALKKAGAKVVYVLTASHTVLKDKEQEE